MGQVCSIWRASNESVVVFLMRGILPDRMTGAGRLCAGRVRAGRKKAPDTLDVHPLGEKEDTWQADADEGNGDLRTKPHGGCGHLVCRRLAECQVVQLLC